MKCKYRKNPICINCGIVLKSNYAIRCKKCNGVYNNPMKGRFGKDNPRYIHGGKTKCVDCGKAINKDYKRCHSCACKYLWTQKDFRQKNRRDGIYNSMYGKKHSLETIRKILMKTRKSVKSPNGLEKDFIIFLNNNGLSKYKFTGDGKYIVERFNPDFVCKEDRKIIELYGDYCHKNDKRHNRRINTYVDKDYDVLIIYESEFRKNKNKILKELLEFEQLEVYNALFH